MWPIILYSNGLGGALTKSHLLSLPLIRTHSSSPQEPENWTTEGRPRPSGRRVVIGRSLNALGRRSAQTLSREGSPLLDRVRARGRQRRGAARKAQCNLVLSSLTTGLAFPKVDKKWNPVPGPGKGNRCSYLLLASKRLLPPPFPCDFHLVSHE